MSPSLLLGSLDHSELATFLQDLTGFSSQSCMDGSTEKFYRLLPIQWSPGASPGLGRVLTAPIHSNRGSVPASVTRVQGEAELLPSIEISCMFTELLSFLEGIY